jgi:hypothetical protein
MKKSGMDHGAGVVGHITIGLLHNHCVAMHSTHQGNYHHEFSRDTNATDNNVWFAATTPSEMSIKRRQPLRMLKR